MACVPQPEMAQELSLLLEGSAGKSVLAETVQCGTAQPWGGSWGVCLLE